jgi:hypothetical protein
MKKIYWIVISLGVLSITLGILLTIKSIELKKWTGDVPVEEFYDRDYSDKSYHINDYRNYGFGQGTYDKESGLLIRERHEGDFYFEPKMVSKSNDLKVVFNLMFFNYGENYRILSNVKDDFMMSLVINFIKEFRYSLLDKSSVLLKEKLNNKKYGDAGLTDIVLDTYNPKTYKIEKEVHKDVFVTPLALKYLQDASSTGCLVFFQFIKSGSDKFSPDVVVKEVVAVGDYFNTYIFKDHSDMIYTKYVVDEAFMKEYINEIIKN